MQYREEIDGLRALAVLPVILFHAGFEWFSGGFVGVDVFFVISGYLITTIIISEMAEGKFSIVNFYERRARRILPALFFVMAACIPFAWLWLTPDELEDFGQSLVAVSFFSSNILFWLESGYFELAVELKPLLHTWSLAVEEQYYVLFPIFLIVMWRFGIKWISVMLAIIFLISLATAQWGAFNKPSANFYLLPTRGWELLIGVFAAIYLKHNIHIKSYYINQLLSLIGFCMIIFSIVAFDKTMFLPSVISLIPTLGTLLIILCAVPKTVVHRLLSFKPIVGIGLISYSTYLWHQPLLAFARQRVIGELSISVLLFICLISILAAWFSWYFVEKPFRNKQQTNRKQIFIFSLSGILLFSFLGLFAQTEYARIHAPSSLKSVEYSSLSEKIETIGEACKSDQIREETFYNYCVIGSKTSSRSVVIYGDSHIAALQYELNKKLSEHDIKGVWIRSIKAGNYECGTTIFTIHNSAAYKNDLLNCPNSFVNALNDFPNAEYIILLNRWSLKYYFSNSTIEIPHFKNIALNCVERNLSYRTYVPFDDNNWNSANEVTMGTAITNFLKLSSENMNTILIYPVPEIGCDPYKYNLNHKRSSGKELQTLSFPVEEYDKRNNFVVGIFDDFIEKNKDSIVPIRLRPIFCSRTNGKECSIIENSTPLYFDDDHLSDIGAGLVVDQIIEELIEK